MPTTVVGSPAALSEYAPFRWRSVDEQAIALWRRRLTYRNASCCCGPPAHRLRTTRSTSVVASTASASLRTRWASATVHCASRAHAAGSALTPDSAAVPAWSVAQHRKTGLAKGDGSRYAKGDGSRATLQRADASSVSASSSLNDLRPSCHFLLRPLSALSVSLSSLS